MIIWPAIIRHSTDPELTCIRDQAEWDGDANLHAIEYDESDYLIDSVGTIHSLANRINDFVIPEANGKTVTLDQILGLVKAHASLTGSCCVSRLYAPTIKEAIRIVEALSET